MHGILSYEERVRLERANGIRSKNDCAPCTDGCPVDETHLVGKTYDDVGDTLQPLNRVCGVTKVIVPVTPAVIVKDEVREVTVTQRDEAYRVVDFDKCSGKNGVLDAIPDGAEIKHAKTEVTVEKVVKDTLFDHAHEVTALKTEVKEDGEVEQPLAVTGEPVVPDQSTEDGKNLVDVADAGQEQD